MAAEIAIGDKFCDSLGGHQASPDLLVIPWTSQTFPELPGSCLATSPELLSLWIFGTGKRVVIPKGVFSLQKSLESLRSLDSLESLENGGILFFVFHNLRVLRNL